MTRSTVLKTRGDVEKNERDNGENTFRKHIENTRKPRQTFQIQHLIVNLIWNAITDDYNNKLYAGLLLITHGVPSLDVYCCVDFFDFYLSFASPGRGGEETKKERKKRYIIVNISILIRITLKKVDKWTFLVALRCFFFCFFF